MSLEQRRLSHYQGNERSAFLSHKTEVDDVLVLGLAHSGRSLILTIQSIQNRSILYDRTYMMNDSYGSCFGNTMIDYND